MDSKNVQSLPTVFYFQLQDTVSVESITFENNIINCVFTRQASLEGDATFYNISGDNEYYILLALGQNINADGKDTFFLVQRLLRNQLKCQISSHVKFVHFSS